jgi:hypothetical protein
MQIKTKGSRVYLLRSSYDPTKKRSIQEVIGSADRYVPRLDPDLEQQLRPEELKQWKDYLVEKQNSDQMANDERRLNTLRFHLEAFRKALEAHPEAVDEHQAEWAKALGDTKAFVNELARKRRKASKKAKPAPPQGTPLLEV